MPPPMTLDAPPAQPVGVQAGGAAPGAPPMAGVGGMLAGQGGAPPGAEGANGQIVSMWEVLQKAIERWGQLHPSLQAFAARMIAVGKSGMQNVVDRGAGGMAGAGGPPRPGPGMPPPGESARPSGMGAGGGFPG